jgi:hypothetical protein
MMLLLGPVAVVTVGGILYLGLFYYLVTHSID